ncbi:MAG: hypothetical protein KDB90_17735 [Planctomycetes bacterium]|nr:hypothetical protein [Planctomycetota bacterium]
MAEDMEIWHHMNGGHDLAIDRDEGAGCCSVFSVIQGRAMFLWNKCIDWEPDRDKYIPPRRSTQEKLINNATVRVLKASSDIANAMSMGAGADSLNILLNALVGAVNERERLLTR